MQWRLISQGDETNTAKLVELYKNNPYHARVIFMNNREVAETHKIVLYEHENGNFEFVQYVKKFGVGVTNRMYRSERVHSKIGYNGKFYYIGMSPSKFSALSINGIAKFASWNNCQTPILDYFYEKFTWTRYIGENKILCQKALNTFHRNKLYNLNDALRFFFKVPAPVAKMIIGSRAAVDAIKMHNDFFTTWSKLKRYLKNVENIKIEMLEHSAFGDTCKMAMTLGHVINCSWGLKRFVAEHDAWAREITDILFEYQPIKELNINSIFKKFSELYGYQLLTTNRDLVLEGRRQNHCVASYDSTVNMGNCAIFHISGYTLDLRYGNSWDSKDDKYILSINQFKGLNNIWAPIELREKVQADIDDYNKNYSGNNEVSIPKLSDNLVEFNGELDF